MKHGADASLSDRFGQTPLLNASKRGHTVIIRYLIEAGAAVNDGSIHEAARELRSEAIQLLLDNGHDPDFPSVNHDGRCALAELCLHASDFTTPVSKIRQTIDVLVAGNCDLTIKSQEKPIIFHALDNPTSSTGVTKALLASGIWRLINQEYNLYTNSGTVYSPTKYIEKELALSPNDQWPELLRILRANGCKDVFYKIDGPQPPDMIGAPNGIITEERRRKTREQRLREQTEDHNIALKRERDIAEQQELLRKRAHALHIQHEQESAEQRDTATENSADLQRRLDAEAATQRQRITETQRTADLAHQRILNQLRLDTTEKEGRLQLEFQKSSVKLQQSVLDARMSAESRRVMELEAAHDRQHQRDVDVISRQERLLTMKKGVMIEENRGSNGAETASAQKVIGYNETDLD